MQAVRTIWSEKHFLSLVYVVGALFHFSQGVRMLFVDDGVVIVCIFSYVR